MATQRNLRKQGLFESEGWLQFDSESLIAPKKRSTIGDELSSRIPFLLGITKVETKAINLYFHESVLGKWGQFFRLKSLWLNISNTTMLGLEVYICRDQLAHFNKHTVKGRQTPVVTWKRNRWPFGWPTPGHYKLVALRSEPSEDLILIKAEFQKELDSET